jgi:hypothetical protein
MVDANPFLKELLSYSQEELLGRELWDTGQGKDEVGFKNAFAVLQMNDRCSMKACHWKKDGQRNETEFASGSYEVDGTRFIQVQDLQARGAQFDAGLPKPVRTIDHQFVQTDGF